MHQVAPDAVGSWVLALAVLIPLLGGCLGIILGMRKLIEQVRVREREQVTRAEVAEISAEVKDLKTKIENFATKTEVKDLTQMIDKQQTYMQQRFHDLANVISPLPTQVAVLVKAQDKVEEKLDHRAVRMERLIALIEKRAGVILDDPASHD